MPATVKVNEEYSVKIQRGIASRIGIEILRLIEMQNYEIVLVTDEKVSGLYLQNAIMNFHDCPKPEGTKLRVCELLIAPNEASKNFGTVAKLLEEMAELGLSGKCCVVAIGGGVVCDAASFAARCYMGGVRLVLVPTTLAAMVKSSAGGQARLNLNAGENLAGMPSNPSLVLCDIECLRTLPNDEYKSGLAEAFKTSIVCGGDLFRIFERGEAEMNIEKVLELCIKFRAGIAGDVERHKELKLGCVFGTAIGALSEYGIQHGLATAQGLGIAARAGEKFGWCSSETAARIIDTLKKNNLPSTCEEFSAFEIAQMIKRTSGKIIDMVVPKEIGRCEVVSVEANEIEKIIAAGL